MSKSFCCLPSFKSQKKSRSISNPKCFQQFVSREIPFCNEIGTQTSFVAMDAKPQTTSISTMCKTGTPVSIKSSIVVRRDECFIPLSSSQSFYTKTKGLDQSSIFRKSLNASKTSEFLSKSFYDEVFSDPIPISCKNKDVSLNQVSENKESKRRDLDSWKLSNLFNNSLEEEKKFSQEIIEDDFRGKPSEIGKFSMKAYKLPKIVPMKVSNRSKQLYMKKISNIQEKIQNTLNKNPCFSLGYQRYCSGSDSLSINS